MDEEEELKRLSEESKKEQIIKYREDSTMPIELAVNLDEGYVRGGIGNQNLVINDDASAILEKELELDDNLKAYLTHELRKGGDEATGIQLKNSNFNIGGSTDYNKEQRANFSGETDTSLGNIGGRFNTDFAQDKSGEIYYKSPDGKLTATGYTDFEDVQQASVGYNTDKLNINYDKDFGGNEYIETEYRPNKNLSFRGGTDFGDKRNISAKGTVPVSKNWVADVLIGRTENELEDENEFLFNLRRKFKN
jgi:hypothetical protein